MMTNFCSKSTYDVYVVGSSMVQLHVWTIGLWPKQVRQCNMMAMDFKIRTELPAVNLRNLLSSSAFMFPIYCTKHPYTPSSLGFNTSGSFILSKTFAGVAHSDTYILYNPYTDFFCQKSCSVRGMPELIAQTTARGFTWNSWWHLDRKPLQITESWVISATISAH